MFKKTAWLNIFILPLFSISPATAQVQPVNSSIDDYLHEYIAEVTTKRIPLMVDREGKKWFEANTSAKLVQAGDLPIWAVSPIRENAELAVAALDDNSILINRIYEIPKTPTSDVYDTNVEANANEITGADVLHSEGYKGDGKAVAILDTGIQAGHDYFKDAQGNSRVVAQACFVLSQGEEPWAKCKNGSDSDLSANSADISHMSSANQAEMLHGTHVAGLAAGRANANAPGGVAPDADIVAVRVFGSQGASDFDIWSALNWVSDNASTYHITAVNLSLGSGLYSPGQCYSDLDIYWEYWYRLIFQELIDVGVAPLVATGNDGAQSYISSPACIEPAIAVGSSNAYDTSLRSYESISYFTNISSQIDLLAPGHNVLSSLPQGQYGLLSGTSMATPVAAGAFTLLQSISSKSVNEWLTILKSTGTPLDGDNVNNIPRININWAACEVLDCLVPPRNISFATTGPEDSQLSWSESPYGSVATSYEIQYGNEDKIVPVPNTEAELVVEDLSQVIQIRSKNDNGVSDWAVLQPFRTSSTTSFKVKNSFARQIIDVQLAGDYCTSNVSPYIAFKYESPTQTLREIWIKGPEGFSSVSETRYIPQNGESLNNDNKTKQIIINDPVSILNSNAFAVVVANENYGPNYALADLYNEIENAEYSPSAPTGLVALGGPSRAVVSWHNDSSGLWKVLVDGEVFAETSTNSIILPLAPGDHDVSICSIKNSGQNTYTSIKSTVSVTAQPGQYQEIQNIVAPTLNAGGTSKAIAASASSGLDLNFTSQTAETCSVNSATGKVTPLLEGNCVVRISQAGDETYAAAESVDVAIDIGVGIPSVVRSLKAKLQNGKVKVTWKKPANSALVTITSYTAKWRVKVPGKNFSSWKTISLNENSLAFLSKKFVSGSRFEFRIFAVSEGGKSPIASVFKTIS